MPESDETGGKGPMDKPQKNVFGNTGAEWEKFQNGDQNAPNRMLEPYIPGLRRFIRRKLGSSRSRTRGVEDHLNEVIGKALASIRAGKYEQRGTGQFYCWLRSLALNYLKDYWGKRPPSIEPFPPDADGRITLPFDVLCRRLFWEVYERALEKLDERKKCVFLHRYELRMPWADVARECGFASDDAARKACADALKKIAKELEDAGFGPGSF